MTSESVENYLKAIYKLEQENEWVATGSIAERLSISPPSVSRMVKKLSKEKSLTHSPYKGVRLTESGRLTALRVIRNHRILESYLVQFLGMAWDIVDAEVESLEHAVSDDLINRMEEALGFPGQDPHGAPIPNRHGVLPELDGTIPIQEMTPAQKGTISRIYNGTPELLSYLQVLGLVPGVVIEFVQQEPFGGPLVVRIAKELIQVGREAGARVQVVPQEIKQDIE